MERTFNKLVRDKIPEIIEQNNEVAITEILKDEDYKKELKNKLIEECNEVTKANDLELLEELADMLEVIQALAKIQNKNLDDILKIKEEKRIARGGFDKKIMLIKTYNKD